MLNRFLESSVRRWLDRYSSLRPMLFSIAILAFTGCGDHPVATATPPVMETAFIGVKFKAGKGLLISSETSAYIGLETGEIAERIIVSTNKFSARFYQAGKASGVVTAEEALLLRAGQSLIIAVDNGESLPGRVIALHHDAMPGGTVEVLLELADDRAPMKPGSFVTVSVAAGKPETVVSVPRSALLRTVEGWFVYTKSGDRLIRAAVKVGVMNDEFAEITDGLYAGDVVALKPVMKLWLAELQAIRGGADND